MVQVRATNETKSAGRKRIPWGGRRYETVSDVDIVLTAVGGRLAEARDILGAVVDEAKHAVRDAAEHGLSDRSIATALGVNRRTVRAWKATLPVGGDQ